IEARREQFANTPFQKHLNVMQQLLMKTGISARQAGQAVTMAGYQVGDFAVQVASGQGAMRAFIQQGTQLVQFFGPWGSVIGATVAVLGALYIGLKKSKEQAKGFQETDLPAWLKDPSRFNDAVESLKEYSEINDQISAA